MSANLPKVADKPASVDAGAGDAFFTLMRDVIAIGPVGLAIFVLIMMLLLFGWIILQQTKTILSIREMTTETDRQVASSLQAIGSQLGTIQFMLMHKGRPDGGSNETA